MTRDILPLPSPITHEAFCVSVTDLPRAWAACDHPIAAGERYLRMVEAAGGVLRFCSACILRIESGALQLVRP